MDKLEFYEKITILSEQIAAQGELISDLNERLGQNSHLGKRLLEMIELSMAVAETQQILSKVMVSQGGSLLEEFKNGICSISEEYRGVFRTGRGDLFYSHIEAILGVLGDPEQGPSRPHLRLLKLSPTGEKDGPG